MAMMADLARDLRHAARGAMRSPGQAAAAVVVLAVGVGANAAVFGLVDGAFLRPPALKEPESLVWLAARTPWRSAPADLSYPDLLECREAQGLFTGLAAYHQTPLALAGGDEPERLLGEIVTSDYFDVVGVKARLGRTFLPEDAAVEGGPPVAVIAHALWTGRFAADSAILDRTILLNGAPFTVVGVAPEGFRGAELGPATQVWVTLAALERARPSSRGLLEDRGASWLRAIGRLAPGVAPARARAALDVVAERLARDHPATHQGFRLIVAPLRGGVHPAQAVEAAPLAALLMAASGFVVLIACANVAGLVLARIVSRRREIAVRAALGASRGRLVRSVLAETFLLAAAGAGAGLLLLTWTSSLLEARAILPPEVRDLLQPGPRMLAYALILAVVSAVLAGLPPALRATRRDLMEAVRQETPLLHPGLARARSQSALVVAQVALSLVLLAGAGLFLSGLRRASAVEPGFDTRDSLTVSFDLGLQGYGTDRARAFHDDLLRRVRALPRVRAATLAALLPLSGRMAGMPLSTAQGGEDGPGAAPTVYFDVVWPGYLSTMGIPLIRGRDFDQRDAAGAPRTVIVNETLARRLWPGADPLGGRVLLQGEEDRPLEVIGVARDGKYDELTEPPRPFAYLPWPQNPGLLSDMTLVARVDGDPVPAASEVRSVLRAMDPALPLHRVGTLAGLVTQRADKHRGMALLLGILGVLAMLLTAVGVYGLTAFTVARRSREIGIRAALGASPRRMQGLFVRDGARLAAAGVAIGLAPALMLALLLSSQVAGVTAVDAAAYLGAATLLIAVAAAASWLPARRAARVDAVVALRQE